MVFRDIWDVEIVRLRLLFAVMLMAFLGLGLALWRIQVAHGKSYQKDLMKQSVRRVRLPGVRGCIFDRNGVRLADNRPSYCIAVYLEELRQAGAWKRTITKIEKQIDELAAALNIEKEISGDDIKAHIKKRLPLPLLAWRDVDESVVARLAEQVKVQPGVDVYVEPARIYPQGNLACHVLGYVGRADPPQDEEEPFHYYLPEMTGKSGIEKKYDGILRGEAGGRLMRVDVSGFRHDDLAVKEPRSGRDVFLSLDVKVQRLAEEAIRDQRGAVVVLDPSNGDVLAMASSPGFDPNEFMPVISMERWKELVEDEQRPLLNRTVAGAYAPGSTFKPVVILAALENKTIDSRTAFTCPGHFMLGRARFNCWYSPGHGTLTTRESLQHSCNVFLFRTALACGYESIYHMAVALGLGRKTDVSLDYELAGLVPDDAWKRRTYDDGWRDGDTCNLSIGQGALLVTPLQMAVLAATIANGGHVYRPRLVMALREPGEEQLRSIPSQVVNEMNWSRATTDLVRGGMRDVVMTREGTGKLAAVPGVTMAGKTGTAEYGRKEEGKKLAWMIAFAPFDHPRYAVAIMIEDAVSGGSSAAPKVQKLMRGLFQDDRTARGEG